MTSANEEQAEFWAGVAPVWLEIEDELEEISRVPGRMAMDRLGLQPGLRVLDLGCGTGRTTLRLAERVAPTGRAIGVDIAAEMLVRAREHGAEAEATNVDFVHADIQAHDLGDRQFDAAYSRFGVMFYTDPVAALSNVNRAMRPGASLSFVCWQPLTANDSMLVPGMAAVSVVGKMPPMPGPEEPGPFSFADPDRVNRILASAGFTDIDIEPHSDSVVTAEDRIPEVAALATRLGAVRELLNDADQATRERARAAIEEALRARVEDGQARASRSILLVTARRQS